MVAAIQRFVHPRWKNFWDLAVVRSSRSPTATAAMYEEAFFHLIRPLAQSSGLEDIALRWLRHELAGQRKDPPRHLV